MNRTKLNHLPKPILFVALFLFILLISVGGAHAAVVFDAASSASTGAPETATLSWSHTVSGADRILLVGVSINGNKTVSSVTYGGDQLTRIATVNQGSSARASLWYLLNPPTGTQTVLVTMSGNARFVAGAHSYTGVSQSNPIGTASVNTGGSSKTATLNLTSATGELAVDVVARRGDTPENPIAAGAGQSERWNTRTTVNSATDGVTGAGSSKAGSSQVSVAHGLLPAYL
jgi:hypothetical protein